MDIATINPITLPSLLLCERAALPDIPAIYFALAADNVVLYIGKAQRLSERWKSTIHHRYAELAQMGDIRLAWLSVDDEALLYGIEAACIDHFKPVLNRSPGPKGSGRADTVKRTYILPVALLERLEAAAQRERRPFGRQLEIFLEKALDQYEQGLQAEKSPGNWEPAMMAA